MRRRVFAVVTVVLAVGSLVSTAGPPANALNPLGFVTTPTVPGSQGGTESSLAIPFEGQYIGLRHLSWQNPGEVNSSMNGTTWGATSTTLQPAGGGDVTNAADAAGALYTVQFCADDQGALHNCLWKSTDGGATWPQKSTLIDNHPGAADRPWIDVYPRYSKTTSGQTPPNTTPSDTTKTYVFNEFHTFSPDDQVYVTRSTDGGATFSLPAPIAVGGSSTFDSECNTVPGGVAVDQNTGTVYAGWLSGNDIADNHATGCNYSQIGPFNKFWVSVSHDLGQTWEAHLAWQGSFNQTNEVGDNANKLFGSIAVDEGGQVHALVTARRNDDPVGYVATCSRGLPLCNENAADTDLLLTTSPDQGEHWTQAVEINQINDNDTDPTTTPHSYFYGWVAAGSKGIVDTIFYRSTTNKPNDPTSTWFAGASQVRNAVATYVSGANAVYTGGGPQVSSETLLEPQSIHGNGTTGGGICTFGIFCTVTGGNRSLADTNIVYIDPAGGSNVSYTANNPPAQSGSANRLAFACQSSGPSAFAGFPDLNGCYGPGNHPIVKLTGHAHSSYSGKKVHIEALSIQDDLSTRTIGPTGSLIYRDDRSNPPGSPTGPFQCPGTPTSLTPLASNKVQVNGTLGTCTGLPAAKRFTLTVTDQGASDAYRMILRNAQGTSIYDWSGQTTVGLGDLHVTLSQG